ncbi:MAG TPA: metal ABC transporter substrate-binding protein [Casimicrobiaceae bacterium]|nr:metal ABC transporter substrate-binding protein [Casimicrobiaceae bacterium]
MGGVPLRAGLCGLVLAAAVAAAAPALAVLRVVATTTDMAALAAAVGGELVTVESIVPPASDPEAFEPRPGDIDKLRHAALLVRVGLGYDYWLDALIYRIGEPRLMRGGEAYVDASTGVPLLEIRGQSVVNDAGHAHGSANPHYWLDPENAIIVTASIAEALVRIAPGQRERIIANRERFLRELKTRRQRWSEVLAPFAGVKLIAYHNSWPYFARRFRLDIVDFIEPKAGVAPSPAHLARLISTGRKAQVRAILHEPYEPEDASQLVARKLGVPLVLLATSVDSVPRTKDYFALLDHNVASLAQALGAQRRKAQ